MILEQILTSEDSKIISYSKGILQISISSVKKFARFFVDNFNCAEFVFRGQENGDKWFLDTSFRRIAKNENKFHEQLKEHLNEFRSATRGRRGANPKELEDDELWALGQHYGLATPLLDWTRSYWVALFFAFQGSREKCKNRAVYACDKNFLRNIAGNESKDIKWIDPNVHDNPRLTSQGGILLKFSINENVENWIQENCTDQNRIVLAKILIPNKDQDYCMRDVNRMNINYLSLFPDLYGAAEYVNNLYRFYK